VTFNTGLVLLLPKQMWISAALSYGSGFLLADGPDHLSPHTTGDAAVGRNVSDKLSLRLTVTNVADAQFLTGFANSFAGTHYQNPREIAIQIRSKFSY
jgi:outer membrane receptor protein involved in Fe transport